MTPEQFLTEAANNPLEWVAQTLEDPGKLLLLAGLHNNAPDEFAALIIKLRNVGVKYVTDLKSRVMFRARQLEAEAAEAQSTSEPPPVIEKPPALAGEADILTLAVEAADRQGMVGEEHLVMIVTLSGVTRLFPKPVNDLVKGQSSVGKSFVVKCALNLFPPEAYYELTSCSEKALIYTTESFEHRILVLYEAVGVSNEMTSYILRSLLSEGCIRYLTTEKTAKGLESRFIYKEGPTGLIMTTTALRIHGENETRMLSLPTTETPEQTARIMDMEAYISMNGVRASSIDPQWRELHRWIAQNPTHVFFPQARRLAELVPPVSVRLRRDFNVVLALIRAHAVLHQLRRERTEAGQILASLEDYAAVRDLVADTMAEEVGLVVSEEMVATVKAVSKLKADNPAGVTTKALGEHLGLDRTTALRRIRKAASAGYVFNNESRRGHAALWETEGQIPVGRKLLPDPEELA